MYCCLQSGIFTFTVFTNLHCSTLREQKSASVLMLTFFIRLLRIIHICAWHKCLMAGRGVVNKEKLLPLFIIALNNCCFLTILLHKCRHDEWASESRRLSNTDSFCELLTLIATVSQQHSSITGQWAQAVLKTAPFHSDKNHLTWTNYTEQNCENYGRNCKVQHSITKIKENSVFCWTGGNKLGVCGVRHVGAPNNVAWRPPLHVLWQQSQH